MKRIMGAAQCRVLGLVGSLLVSSVALGGPPAMTAIEFPVTTASIATAVATAGGVILLAVFGVSIGFRLIKKLARRLTASV